MTDMSDIQLDEVYAFAIQLGKDAGNMLMTAAQRRCEGQNDQSAALEFEEKENAVDIVTATDNGELSADKLVEILTS